MFGLGTLEILILYGLIIFAFYSLAKNLIKFAIDYYFQKKNKE